MSAVLAVSVLACAASWWPALRCATPSRATARSAEGWNSPKVLRKVSTASSQAFSDAAYSPSSCRSRARQTSELRVVGASAPPRLGHLAGLRQMRQRLQEPVAAGDHARGEEGGGAGAGRVPRQGVDAEFGVRVGVQHRPAQPVLARSAVLLEAAGERRVRLGRRLVLLRLPGRREVLRVAGDRHAARPQVGPERGAPVAGFDPYVGPDPGQTGPDALQCLGVGRLPYAGAVHEEKCDHRPLPPARTVLQLTPLDDSTDPGVARATDRAPAAPSGLAGWPGPADASAPGPAPRRAEPAIPHHTHLSPGRTQECTNCS